jgi:hypothetical protein
MSNCVICLKRNGTTCSICYGQALDLERNRSRIEGAKQELKDFVEFLESLDFSSNKNLLVAKWCLIDDYKETRLKELEGVQ